MTEIKVISVSQTFPKASSCIYCGKKPPKVELTLLFQTDLRGTSSYQMDRVRVAQISRKDLNRLPYEAFSVAPAFILECGVKRRSSHKEQRSK